MALKTFAILTVEEYKKMIAMDTADSNVNDFQIESLLNSASQRIESYCNRKFVSPAANISEIFDGKGYESYFVKNRSINDSSTNAPILSYWDGTAWQVMAVATFPREFDDSSGKVYLSSGQKFSSIGYTRFKIEYIYGWARADVPNDVKFACADMVLRSILKLDKAGLKSDTAGASTVSYDLEEFSKTTKNTLDMYKVISFG